MSRRRLATACVVLAASGAIAAIASSQSAGGSDSASQAARAYVQAVLAYSGKPLGADGKTICGSFAPHLRQVFDERAAQQGVPAREATCAYLLHLVIGYPHENEQSRFVGGHLLHMGGERAVVRQGVRYIGISLEARVEGEWSGYAAGHRNGTRFSRSVHDVVWLAPLPGGRFGVAKPSLVLDVAFDSDILVDPRVKAALGSPLDPPPDPNYLTTAEQQAADVRAYRASLRTPAQTP